ncbi:helix-turn-helix transcriptional regulator, partial [Aeromonas hydrophila]
NTQHTTHNTQHTTHNTQHTTHNTQHTTRNTQYAIRNTQYAIRNTQYAIRNTQYITITGSVGMKVNYNSHEKLLNRKLRKELSEKLKFIGSPYFSYVIYAKNEMSSHAMISNFPEYWLIKYNKRKFYKEDPIIKQARISITPFSWFDDNKNKFEDINGLEIHSNKNQEVVTGFTFTLHDHLNNFAALSVCDVESGNEFLSMINKYESKLQMTLIETHCQVVTLLSEQMSENIRSTALTAREREVLHWACMGKTYEEISIILEIKHVTVKYHAANLCRKIDAKNIKQAIRKYTELNLV